MCGFVFIYNKSGLVDYDFEAGWAYQLLKRRGPDNIGIVKTDKFQAFHSRLSIKDKNTEANQPFWDSEKRYFILYNGEIYNYKSLKKELENKGVKFRTECDTEVLLYGLLTERKSFLSKIVGMYSFVLFDTVTDEILVGRDSSGVKHVYYSENQSRFVVSNILNAHTEIMKDRSVVKEKMIEALQFRYTSNKETIFRNIFRVLPGEFINLTKKEINNIQFTSESNDLENSISACVDEEKAAIILSGGLDSRLLASVLSEKASIKAYHLSMGDVGDESKEAKWISDRLGISFECIDMPKTFYKNYESAVLALEEPIFDGIISPTLHLFQNIKEKVVYSGEGADELFGGYVHHGVIDKVARFRKVVGVKTLSSILNYASKFPSMINVAYPGKFDKAAFVRLKKAFSNSGTINLSYLNSVFSRDELISLSGYDSFRDCQFKNIDEVLDFELSNWCAHYNLLRLDKLAMYCGIEVRVPYLNQDIVSKYKKMPYKEKSKTGNKDLLRSIEKEISKLDLSKLAKKKRPFHLAIEDHLSMEFRDYLFDIIKSNIPSDLFNKAEVNKLLSPYEKKEWPRDILSNKKIMSLFLCGLWYSSWT